MKEVIMKVPSFSADYPKTPIYVAELVRCKECKHWSGCKSTMHNNHLCGRAQSQNVDYWTRADDFCSYGEREGE